MILPLKAAFPKYFGQFLKRTILRTFAETIMFFQPETPIFITSRILMSSPNKQA